MHAVRAPTLRLVPAILALVALAIPYALAYELTLSSGPPGGTYDELGRAIGELCTSRGQIIHLAVIGSPGSIGNLRRLEEGAAQLAFVQSDLLRAAARGTGVFPRPLRSVRAVAALYDETLHIVVNKESGITTVAELRGRRVSLGAEQSGSRATAESVLLAHGVDPRAIVEARLEPAAAADALARGEIDGFCIVTGLHSAVIDRALRSGHARLIPIDPDVIGSIEADTGIVAGDLFPEDYPGLLDEPLPAAVVSAVLCARPDVPADVIYEMLGLCFHEIRRFAPGGEASTGDGQGGDGDGSRETADATEPKLAPFRLLEELTPESAQRVPHALHPGAVRFYYEHDVVERPVKVYTGFFIKEIYDFELQAQTFRVNGGIWFRWRGRLEGEDEKFDFRLTNGELDACELRETRYFGGWTYVYYELTATMRGEFLLHDYPFDTQVVDLEVEHKTLDDDHLVFVADEKIDGGGRDLLLSLGRRTVQDWHVSRMSHEVSTYDPQTDLGNPLAGQEQKQWSRYRLNIELRRLLLPYLLKFSVPLLIIGLMTYSVFFISREAAETKLLIIIWDLFIAVEYHTVQSDSLPEIGYLVMADKFFLIAYVAIFLVLAFTLVEDAIHRRDPASAVLRTMRRAAFVLFPIVYFGPIALLIATALRAHG